MNQENNACVERNGSLIKSFLRFYTFFDVELCLDIDGVPLRCNSRSCIRLFGQALHIAFDYRFISSSQLAKNLSVVNFLFG